MKVVPVCSIWEAAIDHLQEMARKAEVNLRRDCPAADVSVLANPVRSSFVIRHLIDNNTKFTDRIREEGEYIVFARKISEACGPDTSESSEIGRGNSFSFPS